MDATGHLLVEQRRQGGSIEVLAQAIALYTPQAEQGPGAAALLLGE